MQNQRKTEIKKKEIKTEWAAASNHEGLCVLRKLLAKNFCSQSNPIKEIK
jgi:hypothetical protein